MSVSSNDSVFGFTAGQYIIPSGISNAVYFDTSTIPGCNYVQFSYQSGGTLGILGAPLGATLTGAQMQTGISLGLYTFKTTEIMPIYGCPRGYLLAQGATTFVNFLYGLSQGR